MIAALAFSVWGIWKGARRNKAYFVVALAVVFAVALLVVDPAQHMRYEHGEGQWFT